MRPQAIVHQFLCFQLGMNRTGNYLFSCVCGVIKQSHASLRLNCGYFSYSFEDGIYTVIVHPLDDVN